MSLENEIQRWRKNYEQDMNAHFAERGHQAVRVAVRTIFTLSAEDCVFLWDAGIRAEENICLNRESV